MSYDTADIAARLQAARKAKGLSQRELSDLPGVPQAQISRIEVGTVDLRLSSLMALAHALDLELTLVPRKAMPAVRSLSRDAVSASRKQAKISDQRRARLRWPRLQVPCRKRCHVPAAFRRIACAPFVPSNDQICTLGPDTPNR